MPPVNQLARLFVLAFVSGAAIQLARIAMRFVF